MSQPTPEALQRTRAFARVIGPFVVAATLIVAIRLPDLTGLIDELVTTSSSRRTAAARSSPTS